MDAATLLLVVLALVLIPLVVGSVRQPRVSLRVEGDALRVHLSPGDKLLCARGDLVVPLAQVEGVAAAPSAQVPRTGFRLPGTSLPGVVRAGSYGTGNKRDLWDVRRAQGQLLVVELRPGAPYRRIVLEVADPHAEALRLRPAVGAFAGSFEA